VDAKTKLHTRTQETHTPNAPEKQPQTQPNTNPNKLSQTRQLRYTCGDTPRTHICPAVRSIHTHTHTPLSATRALVIIAMLRRYGSFNHRANVKLSAQSRPHIRYVLNRLQSHQRGLRTTRQNAHTHTQPTMRKAPSFNSSVSAGSSNQLSIGMPLSI
jgi:hypothetical protein